MKWLLVFMVFVFPGLVSAQNPAGYDPAGLVTCSGPNCNFCTLVAMVNGMVEWLFGFLVLAAVLGLMIAGFRLVTSAGNSSAWSAAKSMFTNIVIGFVIVLSAWLIVDTVMKAFISDEIDFGPWNQIDTSDCGGIKTPMPAE